MNRYQGGDAKRHYKMFKSGKHWAFMAITTVSIASGLAFAQTNTTHAATDTDSEPTVTSAASATKGTGAATSAAAISSSSAASSAGSATGSIVTSSAASSAASDASSVASSAASSTASDGSSAASSASSSAASSADSSAASSAASDGSSAANSSEATNLESLISAVEPSFVKAEVLNTLKGKTDDATASELGDKVAKLVSNDDGTINSANLTILGAQVNEVTGTTNAFNLGAMEKDFDLILSSFNGADGKLDKAKADAALASISDKDGHLDLTKTAAFLEKLTGKTPVGTNQGSSSTQETGTNPDSGNTDSGAEKPVIKDNDKGVSTKYFFDFSQYAGVDISNATSKMIASIGLRGLFASNFPNQTKDNDVETAFSDQILKLFLNAKGQYVTSAGTNFINAVFKNDLAAKDFETAKGDFDKSKWDAFLNGIVDKNGLFDHAKYTAYVKAQTGKQDSWYAYSQPATDLSQQYQKETDQADPDKWVNPNLAVVDPTNPSYLAIFNDSKDTVSITEPTDQFATKALNTKKSSLAGTYDEKTGIVTFKDGSTYNTKTDTLTLPNPYAKTDPNATPESSGLLLAVYKDGLSTTEAGKYNAQTGLIEFSDGTYYIPDTETVVFSNAGINNGALYKVQNLKTGEALSRAGVYYKSGSGWFTAKSFDTSTVLTFLLKVHKAFPEVNPDMQKLTDMVDSYYKAHLDELGHPKESPLITFIYSMANIMAKMKNASDQEITDYFHGGQLPYTISFLNGIDAFKAWESGYDGTGMVVAVIDNGLEPVTDMRLNDDSKAAISKDDAEKLIAQKGYGTYISDKIPFAYNYVDNDSDSTSTYEVDHGMHVAGIIAADGQEPALSSEQKAIDALSSADGSGALTTEFTTIFTKLLTTGKLDKDALDKLTTDLKNKMTDPTQAQDLTSAILGLLNKTGDDSSKDSTATKTDMSSKTDSTKYAIGIAPQAQILDLRVISNSSASEAQELAKAIRDAVDLGADVINMSLGSTYMNEDDENIEELAVQYAFDHGVVVNVSASNSGTRAETSTGGGQAYKPENYSQLSNPATSPYSIAVAASGDLSVDNQMSSMMGLDSGVGMVAQFSSWGPNSDFTLKPDVTGPGVNLDSLEYEDQDQQMSGTSMSAPTSSGITTLIEQRLKKLGFTGKQLALYTKLAEMNSAIMISDENTGNAFSPRQQGAGLADAGLATETTVAVEGDANTGSVSLKNIGKKTDITLHFTNYGDHDVTYTFKPDKYTVLKNVWDTDANGKLIGNGVSHDETLAGADVSMANDTFTIKAGQTQDIKLTLNIGDSVTKDQIVEGFLRFASNEKSGANNVTVPYLAFYGDLTDENVFDLSGAGYTSYLADGQSQLPLGIGSDSEAVKVYVDQAASNFANGYSDKGDDAKGIKGTVAAADAFKASISPNADGDNDSVTPVVYVTQNLKSITAEILDAKGNVVRILDQENNLDASGVNATASGLGYTTLAQSYTMAYDRPDALTWDGTVYDQSTGKFVKAADGKYTYRIIGTMNYEGAHKSQTKDFGLTIDTQAPTFKPQFDAANDTIAFNYTDKGIGFTNDSLLIYTIGGKDHEINLGNNGTSNDGHFSYKLSAEEVAALKASDGSLKLAIHDAAGNTATVTLKTGVGAGTAAKPTTGDKENAPLFQFYLAKGKVLDSTDGTTDNSDLTGITGVNLAEFGFAVDSVSTPLYQGKTDDAILKAKVSGPAGTQYFVKNEITGQVYTPSGKDADGNLLFKVDGIEHAEDLMINLGAALYTGYAIAPTDQAGVYKESLIDSILLSTTSTSQKSANSDDFETTFVDSKDVSPFTDTKYLSNLIHQYDQKDGSNKYDGTGWDPTADETGYQDSHEDNFLLPELDYRTNNNWREKGHTIDTNHTTIDNGTNKGAKDDIKMPDQDVLTLDTPVETTLNTKTDDKNFDRATGEYTITGKLKTAGYSTVEEAKYKHAALYILGNSSYEDDPANKVTINADGTFSYKVKIPNDADRAIGYILIYQLTNQDGTAGELRIYRNDLVFYQDQDDPTLALDVAGLDTGKPTEDGTYQYKTNKDTFDLSAVINDNADDYTLTVNGNQVFRQKNQGEPENTTKTNVFGPYTYNGSIPLRAGKNVITLEATDQLGNTVTKTIEVTRVDATATTGTTADQGGTNDETTSDKDAGYKEGYHEGATGAQLKNLSGMTAEYIQGFTEGYNAGAVERNAKLAAQLAAAKAQQSAATTDQSQPAAANGAAQSAESSTTDQAGATTASSASTEGSGAKAALSPKEQAATGNLPKTGDQQSTGLAMLGAAIMSGLAMAFGFGDRRKRN